MIGFLFCSNVPNNSKRTGGTKGARTALRNSYEAHNYTNIIPIFVFCPSLATAAAAAASLASNSKRERPERRLRGNWAGGVSTLLSLASSSLPPEPLASQGGRLLIPRSLPSPRSFVVLGGGACSVYSGHGQIRRDGWMDGAWPGYFYSFRRTPTATWWWPCIRLAASPTASSSAGAAATDPFNEKHNNGAIAAVCCRSVRFTTRRAGS